MIVKDSLRLVSNSPNITSLAEPVIKSFYNEENSSRHVFAILELKQHSIIHFTKDTIFKLISNIKKREVIRVISFDYPLPVTYNSTTKNMIINLKALNAKTVSNMNPNDLYASIVYAYTFATLATKKFKIVESHAKQIINYFLSFYVQVF